MNFNYFYKMQADEFSFIRIPKALMTEEVFSDLSIDAKILYGLLMDRMSLSVKNEWLDEQNRAYICTTVNTLDTICCVILTEISIYAY